MLFCFPGPNGLTMSIISKQEVTPEAPFWLSESTSLSLRGLTRLVKRLLRTESSRPYEEMSATPIGEVLDVHQRPDSGDHFISPDKNSASRWGDDKGLTRMIDLAFGGVRDGPRSRDLKNRRRRL